MSIHDPDFDISRVVDGHGEDMSDDELFRLMLLKMLKRTGKQPTMDQRFDQLELALANAMGRSRSRTFGSNG